MIDKLIRSTKRKSLSLAVDADGKIIVRAPQHVPLDTIQKLVEGKKDWLRDKQAQQLERLQARPEVSFNENSEFYFKGAKYPLRFIPAADATAPIYFDKAFIISEDYKTKARQMMQALYELKAEQYISERAELYARTFELKYRKIRIADTKSQWGSCSISGDLSFCWRLIMYPSRIIDYVVAHELAHLKEMNHSAQFWNLVEKMRPDYRESQTWLKANKHLFHF
ncbi:MAG: M48 family metallopeptidase [Victivallales bacterium]|nr:M48 family metallopeptidase [Victivallales bacterium]